MKSEERNRAPAERVRHRLLESLPGDLQDLLPHLEENGLKTRHEVEKRLAERGKVEAGEMRRILEEQKQRVSRELGKTAASAQGPVQRTLFDLFDEQEKKQLESNRRYWQRWLEHVETDLRDEPTRISDFYQVTSFRIERDRTPDSFEDESWVF